MKRFSWTLLLLAGLLGSAVPAAAAIESCFEFPTNSSDADQNAGLKKQIELQIGHTGCTPLKCIPDPADPTQTICDPELPLTLLPTATATLTLGTATPLSCKRNVITPALGECGFFIGHGLRSLADVNDTVLVVYNSLLPAGKNVTVSIDGVQDKLGGTAGPKSWRFHVSSTPPRPAVGLELVFDTSQSMEMKAVPSGKIQRIEALRKASRVVFQLLNFYTMMNDLVGLVTFNTKATAFDPTPGGSNLAPADVPASGEAIQAELARVKPDGVTSIGAGLKVADTAGFSQAAAPKKAVLLFSDGEQNTEPCVRVPDPPDPQNPRKLQLVTGIGLPPGRSCTSAPGGTLEDYPVEIDVCPITAGLETADGFKTQQAIANARCDHQNGFISADSDLVVVSDLESFLIQRVTKFLVGDKLELARDTIGSLDAGATAVVPFLANADDVSMGLLLTWPGVDLDRLPIRLQAPDGTFVEGEAQTRRDGHTSLTHLHLPRHRGHAPLRTAGEWKIHVGGPDVPALSYHLVVVLDNSTFASEFSAPIADAGTGEPIPLQVKLTERGHPVRHATVTAAVSGPKEGLGDVLSSFAAPASRQAPETGPEQGPDRGPKARVARKLEALRADPAAVARLADRPIATVTLLDNGSAANGDAKAGDGIYSGLFRDTGEEGHYQFVFDAAGKAPSNGPFQRTQRLSVFVRPKPDPARPLLRVASSTAGDGGSLLVLEARPQDALGNLLGPGYLGSLAIDVEGGKVVEPLADDLAGTYTITYRIPAGADPRATLTVLGKPVIDQPVSRLPTHF